MDVDVVDAGISGESTRDDTSSKTETLLASHQPRNSAVIR
jgi:hypothetical protein